MLDIDAQGPDINMNIAVTRCMIIIVLLNENKLS